MLYPSCGEAGVEGCMSLSAQLQPLCVGVGDVGLGVEAGVWISSDGQSICSSDGQSSFTTNMLALKT